MTLQTAESEAVVSATDLRRTYYLGEPVHAIDGISLDLPEGSYTAVMGPSGSGKSTLMNLLGCLDTPDEGTVEVGGQSISDLSGAQRATLRGSEIGFIFQTFNLMGRLSAVENVALPTVFSKAFEGDAHERAESLLERVGLGDRLDHQPSELSGGQRQRVAIARALVNDPSVILADEPTGNLDTDTGADIMELFADLNEEGRTILMVTHERHIAKHADRIIHLVDGQIESIEDLESSSDGEQRNNGGEPADDLDETTGEADVDDGGDA